MNGGIQFDNFYITNSTTDAKEWGEMTWKTKFNSERDVEIADKRRKAKDKREHMRKEGGFSNLSEVYILDGIDWMIKHPYISLTCFLSGIIGLFALALRNDNAEKYEDDKEERE